MSERLEFYKCETCGTIVQVFHRGDGQLVCCGHPMKYLQKYTVSDELEEKHVPIFEDDKIHVGSMPHPMVPEHHIEFIETVSKDKKRLEVTFLDVTDNPEAVKFNKEAEVKALEYCNIHGLWTS